MSLDAAYKKWDRLDISSDGDEDEDDDYLPRGVEGPWEDDGADTQDEDDGEDRGEVEPLTEGEDSALKARVLERAAAVLHLVGTANTVWDHQPRSNWSRVLGVYDRQEAVVGSRPTYRKRGEHGYVLAYSPSTADWAITCPPTPGAYVLVASQALLPETMTAATGAKWRVLAGPGAADPWSPAPGLRLVSEPALHAEMSRGAATIHFVDDARSRTKDSAQAACRERGGAIFGTYDRLPELHNGRHLYLLRGTNHKVSVLWWSEASSAWVITVNVAPAILCKLPDTSPRLGASFCAYDPSPLPEGITSPWSVAAVGETAKLLKWEEVLTVHCRPGPTPEDAQKAALAKENAQKAVEARKVAEKESARKAMALEAEEEADEQLKRAMAAGGIETLRAAIETHQKDVSTPHACAA